MKKICMFVLLSALSMHVFADDSQESSAKEVANTTGQPTNFEVDSNGSLFSDIKGKRTLIASSKLNVQYASVTFSENGLIANVYGPSGNLLRAIPCYQYCSDSDHSNHVIYMNSMDGSTKEMAPSFINENDTGDYLIVFPSYVKIGYRGENYYAYWRD